ncbi:conserved hypothetical protein [Culex quinquefasciatus]|uniref:Uncharacterized protein n=1 Tax=Culex quinquefasciatus TaxID=7176 RepID=B0W5L8_CULQU|nr:conserved hypothetical protein [Culex quinquefasciatus]|eukprot:XP_001844002.1 conserved hypothetical protein [Culex quinquefasciatus]
MCSYFDTRGDILEVKKISPTRLVRGSGLVSKADERGGEIMTDDGKYYYCIDVIIKNEARHQHQILFISITTSRQTSQLTLLSPLEKEHFIQSGESIKYCFEVTAKNYGISKEVVYWRFGGGFKIGRCITIAVGDSDIIVAQPTNEGTTQARSKAGVHRLAAWNESACLRLSVEFHQW